MKDLPCIVRDYTVKYENTIKKICSPLQHYLNIFNFGYCRLQSDGTFGNISNDAELLDFYYSEKLYMSQFCLKDPRLLRSGYAILSIAHDPKNAEILLKKYNLNTGVLLLECCGDTLEGFLFSPKASDSNSVANLLPKLEVMRKFAKYFKQEAKHLIGSMMSEGYNLKTLKGDLFSEDDPYDPLSVSNYESANFFKAISQLTPREQQCFELFQQGKSAQLTAAMLGISRRTVEHHFEHIKQKLKSHSNEGLA